MMKNEELRDQRNLLQGHISSFIFILEKRKKQNKTGGKMDANSAGRDPHHIIILYLPKHSQVVVVHSSIIFKKGKKKRWQRKSSSILMIASCCCCCCCGKKEYSGSYLSRRDVCV